MELRAFMESLEHHKYKRLSSKNANRQVFEKYTGEATNGISITDTNTSEQIVNFYSTNGGEIRDIPLKNIEVSKDGTLTISMQL